MVNTSVNGQSGNSSAVILIGCMFIAAVLCYAQIRGSLYLIFACLMIFLFFLVWACWKKTALPVLLFFLPWSPLLKLYNGSISFFTIALLMACLFYFWKSRLKLDLRLVILAMFILGITLTAKIIQNNSLENSYLCFFAMLLIFPSIVRASKTEVSFIEMTVFFACGIITTALSAQYLYVYPNISKYIKVYSYATITRLSGYYGDPNFYSAQITACLAGILVLLMYEKKKSRQIYLMIFAAILLYCGFLSASKSFVIVIGCLLLIWLPMLLGKSIHKKKFGLLAGILCVGILILSSPAFQDLFQIMEDRFSYSSNLSQLTTGRTELWSNYFNELMINIPLLLFGEGYSNINLYGRASHNTIIQGFYQFGLIGFPIFIAWMYYMLKNVLDRKTVLIKNWGNITLMCIGIILPWMALDLLFFDEIFILPVYGAVGIVYAAHLSES